MYVCMYMQTNTCRVCKEDCTNDIGAIAYKERDCKVKRRRRGGKPRRPARPQARPTMPRTQSPYMREPRSASDDLTLEHSGLPHQQADHLDRIPRIGAFSNTTGSLTLEGRCEA